MRLVIFAYWIIYEQFYKRRKGIETDFIKSWRNAFRRLEMCPGFYDEARRIHEREKADK